MFTLNKLALFLLLILSIHLGIASCNSNDENLEEKAKAANYINKIPNIPFTIISQYPHDINSFTEGLLFEGGVLYESTGSPSDLPQTNSVLGSVNLKTGKINEHIVLDKKKYFGEGIVFLNDKIYQLTYLNQVCFVYDSKSFKKIREFSYTNEEGWGLTTDGNYIIMSDGSNRLSYINSENFKTVKFLNVTENGLNRDNLNELEYIEGFIYANVWLTNYIVKIDTLNGEVVGKLDLTSLAQKAKQKNPACDVLNGIAYDSKSGKILITGKLWPFIYQIDFPH